MSDSPSLISRRSVLGTAAVMAATPALAEECRIGPPPHEKGAKVWMDMDQVELDASYDQAAYAPMINQFTKRFASISETTRKRLGAPKRFAYGPTPIEGLDLFPAKSANAPIFVFVHGGRWIRGMASDYAYPADLFVNSGVNYVALDFIAVDAAGGDLRPMADQVRRGIAWVYKNAASFGGDTRRFYIGGHSSGPYGPNGLAALKLMKLA
jgi:arylformamidase